MARAPIAAAAPPVAGDDAAAAPAATAMPAADDMSGEDDDDAGTVLCTVLKKADGSLVLQMGDEPEAGDDGTEPMPAAEGQTFQPDESGIGKLLVAIHNVVDPENAEGPAAQANFKAGFDGEEAKEPAAA